MDRYGGLHAPISIPKRVEGLFSNSDLARMLASTSDDVFKTKERIRHYMAQGYMFPAAFDEEKRSFLHLGDSVLTGSVLLRMCEMGMKSADAAHAVSLAVHIWTAADAAANPDRARSPGLQVIAEHAQGFRDWTLELWTFADTGGTVRFAARLYPRNRDTPMAWHFDVSGLEPRAVLAVDLSAVLDRLAGQKALN